MEEGAEEGEGRGAAVGHRYRGHPHSNRQSRPGVPSLRCRRSYSSLLLMAKAQFFLFWLYVFFSILGWIFRF